MVLSSEKSKETGVDSKCVEHDSSLSMKSAFTQNIGHRWRPNAKYHTENKIGMK